MSTEPAPQLVLSCAALGDETRWRILVRLGRQPASASALAAELPVTRQAIARHLEVLRAAGLVEVERRGREVVHRALGSRLSEVADDLAAVALGWEQQLAALKVLAETRAAGAGPTGAERGRGSDTSSRAAATCPPPVPGGQAGPSDPAG